MFYDLFKTLCDEKGVSVSKACIEMGLSRSIAAKWKNTKTNPSAEVIPKIAKYFGVTADYLLTGDKKDNAPPESGMRISSDDDIKFALFGTREIDDDVLEQVKSFAKFARENRKDK